MSTYWPITARHGEKARRGLGFGHFPWVGHISGNFFELQDSQGIELSISAKCHDARCLHNPKPSKTTRTSLTSPSPYQIDLESLSGRTLAHPTRGTCRETMSTTTCGLYDHISSREYVCSIKIFSTSASTGDTWRETTSKTTCGLFAPQTIFWQKFSLSHLKRQNECHMTRKLFYRLFQAV